MQVNSGYQVTPMRHGTDSRTDAPSFSLVASASTSRASDSTASPSTAAVSNETPEVGASLGASLRASVETINAQEAELETALRRTLRGDTPDSRELLELQATVYAYSVRVDVATRVVDRAAGGLRQLLQIQL